MTFVIVMGFHQIIVVMNDVKRHTYIHTYIHNTMKRILLSKCAHQCQMHAEKRRHTKKLRSTTLLTIRLLCW